MKFIPTCVILALLLLAPPQAQAAPQMRGEVNVSPAMAIGLALHEEPKAENRIDFSLDGKPLQTETALGDHFQPFLQNGRSAFFHAADLFHDGHKEIFVRLTMVPMGVMRVFRWSSETHKLERMTFGKKKEDGLPLPLTLPVSLESNGDLTYVVKRKAGRKAKFRLHWNGKDYELPAREVR